MKQSYNHDLSNMFWFLSILLLSLTIGIGMVFLSPMVLDIVQSAFKGRISYILTIISTFMSSILIIIGLANKNWKTLYPVYPLIGFMITTVVSNMFFESSRADLRWLFISIGFPLIYMTLTGYIKSYKMLLLLLLATTLILTFVVIMLTFTDSAGNFPSLNGALRNRYRVYLFNNQYGPVTLATLSSTLFILSISLLVTVKDIKSFIISFFLLLTTIISFIALIASGGRTAWVSTFLSLLIIFWGLIKFKNIDRNSMILYFVLLIFLISSLPFWIGQQILERIFTIPAILSQPELDASYFTRITLWNDSVSLALSNPNGIGFNTFQQIHGYTTHNEILNILLGGGWISLFLFGLFYLLSISFVIKALNSKTDSKYKSSLIFLLALQLHIFLISLTEAWSISNTVAGLSFAIIFSASGVLAYLQIKYDKNNQKGEYSR